MHIEVMRERACEPAIGSLPQTAAIHLELGRAEYSRQARVAKARCISTELDQEWSWTQTSALM